MLNQKKARLSLLASIATLTFIAGCGSSLPIYDVVRYQDPTFFINPLNIMHLLIGFGIAWYCWKEAQEKNRNSVLWLSLGFIFGLLALIVIAYLKKLPAPSIEVEHEIVMDEEENHTDN